MGKKKFILNADDFGINNDINRGILESYNNGFLTSASICAIGTEFNSAVNEILPECPKLGIGVHLNISNGKPLTKTKLLTDNKNKFNNTFIALWFKSHNKDFLKEIENEFRAQIEKVKNYSLIDHINSHGHIHAIPAIFKIVVKLAVEYEIPFVRLPKEEIILLSDLNKFLNPKFPISFLKTILLNIFSKINAKTAKENGIKTNTYTNGELYRGFLCVSLIDECINSYDTEGIIECIVIPDKNRHKGEYEIAMSKELEDKVYRAGFDLTNYKKLK